MYNPIQYSLQLYNRGTFFHFKGVYLKNKINNVQPEQSKWSPRSKDLIKTNMVPVELFNHIAHITGAVSDDEYTNVTNDRCVDIAEEFVPKVNAICQDIVYVSSKGRKQTPKFLALGLTVRHMTGSTHLLQILAKLHPLTQFFRTRLPWQSTESHKLVKYQKALR